MDDLAKYVKTLRKLCHEEGCPNIVGCPKYHISCDEKLNIETSCYWQAAKHINIARRFLPKDYDIDAREGRILAAIDALNVILDILWPHYTGNIGYYAIREAVILIQRLYNTT